MEVYSEVGKGTSVKVYLPRIDQPAVAKTEAPRETTPQGHETILLVEDEESVRDLMRVTLRRQGYKVLDAPDAAEARRIGAKYKGAIHLLITDVVMPRESGRDMAGSLVSQRNEPLSVRPPLRVDPQFPTRQIRHHLKTSPAVGPSNNLPCRLCAKPPGIGLSADPPQVQTVGVPAGLDGAVGLSFSIGVTGTGGIEQIEIIVTQVEPVATKCCGQFGSRFPCPGSWPSLIRQASWKMANNWTTSTLTAVSVASRKPFSRP